ncbi:MAG: PorP/SprF family type IX secretion system membrane protein [Lewinellaceae bacterium]|nr:PorP/SprF family type IX secretion system membrane protein [Lewinellaceae bacterium]MCB9288595.1 PorP/SprF family type IX secretion system membrane protein [Lewinellaceae bacterium]
MKKFLPLFFLLAIAATSLAQDQHFTQFFASPLTLNPALTGTFDGKYRVAFIYRDQEPYKTFAGAIDLRFNMRNIGKRYKDAFGVGVVFYNDKVPEVGYSNNQISVFGGFHKSLTPKNDQFLSIGGQAGISQRNFSYGNLFFEDQFSGSAGYDNPTSEIFPENNFAFADFSVGINYSYSPERAVGLYAGAALHHILEPEASFYASNEDPDLANSNPLLRKYSAYINLKVPVGESIQFHPRALVYNQGPHLALNAGSNIRFLIDEISGTALHVGAWVRPVRNAGDSFSLDAIVGMVGIEYSNFLLGISYDARTNALGTPRERRGAIEISIAYLGEYEDEVVLCPKF